MLNEGLNPSYDQPPPAQRNGHYPSHPGMNGGSRGPPPGPYPHTHAHHHYDNGIPGAPHSTYTLHLGVCVVEVWCGGGGLGGEVVVWRAEAGRGEVG